MHHQRRSLEPEERLHRQPAGLVLDAEWLRGCFVQDVAVGLLAGHRHPSRAHRSSGKLVEATAATGVAPWRRPLHAAAAGPPITGEASVAKHRCPRAQGDTARGIAHAAAIRVAGKKERSGPEVDAVVPSRLPFGGFDRELRQNERHAGRRGPAGEVPRPQLSVAREEWPRLGPRVGGRTRRSRCRGAKVRRSALPREGGGART
mmetsp:Transcript_78693/g.228407  ORF Transcript_78693/g.228407 Transcript_78693/m.228407 type:complete len:204 (+) Transcript_78693:634-1245(+)